MIVKNITIEKNKKKVLTSSETFGIINFVAARERTKQTSGQQTQNLGNWITRQP